MASTKKKEQAQHEAFVNFGGELKDGKLIASCNGKAITLDAPKGFPKSGAVDVWGTGAYDSEADAASPHVTPSHIAVSSWSLME